MIRSPAAANGRSGFRPFGPGGADLRKLLLEPIFEADFDPMPTLSTEAKRSRRHPES